jgi:hypothetical protein
MDRWLNDGPALAYVNELYAWVVVNNKGELISFTKDPAELAWLLPWVMQYKATIKEANQGTNNFASNGVGRRRRRVSSRQAKRNPRPALP